MPRPLVIIDRDGVINRDSRAFIRTIDEWQPLPGSIDAIADLSKAGFRIGVASNQSGIARGLVAPQALAEMHRELQRLVEGAGGRVDHIVYCPHGPDDDCDCRKPRPGLFTQLAEHFDTGLDGVPAIGDSLRDLEAAAAAGARPILVRTGNGRETEKALAGPLASVPVFDDLAAVARQLVAEQAP